MNTEQKPSEFQISIKLLNEVGAYLMTKPYAEVSHLIEKLRQLKPILEDKKADV